MLQKLRKLGNYLRAETICGNTVHIPKMAKIAGYEFLLNIFVEVATVVILEWFAKLLQNSLILASIAKKCLQEYPKKPKTMSPYKIKKKERKSL